MGSFGETSLHHQLDTCDKLVKEDGFLFVFVEDAEHFLSPEAAEMEEGVEVFAGEEFGGGTMRQITIHKIKNKELVLQY